MDVFVHDVSLRVGEHALKGLWTQQELIADNIANVNTPGYRAKSLDFDGFMRQALRANSDIDAFVRQDQRTQFRTDGNQVDVEREMVLMMENSLRYRSVLSQVNRKMDMLNSIVRS